jgi:hypothetical protein
MLGGRKVSAAAAALCTIVLSLSVAQTTSAAWTDEVVAAADASAGHWQVQTAAPTPFEPGEPGSTLSAPTWSFGGDNTAGFCGTLTVTSTSPSPQPWSVIIRLDQAPFWGASASQLWVEGSLGVITQSPTDASRAVIRGNPATASVEIDVHTPLTMSICSGTGRPAPAGDPAWYTVTSSASGVWTRTLACVQTTVTGTVDPAVYPYFFGWVASIDLSGAKAAVRAAGGTPTHVSWTPDSGGGYDFTFTPRPGTGTPGGVAAVYDLEGGVAGDLRGGTSFAVTACVNAY